MTLEEALEASGAEPVNDIFQINPDGRKKRMRLGRCGHW